MTAGSGSGETQNIAAQLAAKTAKKHGSAGKTAARLAAQRRREILRGSGAAARRIGGMRTSWRTAAAKMKKQSEMSMTTMAKKYLSLSQKLEKEESAKKSDENNGSMRGLI